MVLRTLCILWLPLCSLAAQPPRLPTQLVTDNWFLQDYKMLYVVLLCKPRNRPLPSQSEKANFPSLHLKPASLPHTAWLFPERLMARSSLLFKSRQSLLFSKGYLIRFYSRSHIPCSWNIKLEGLARRLSWHSAWYTLWGHEFWSWPPMLKRWSTPVTATLGEQSWVDRWSSGFSLSSGIGKLQVQRETLSRKIR